jgi:hypothetical protein
MPRLIQVQNQEGEKDEEEEEEEEEDDLGLGDLENQLDDALGKEEGAVAGGNADDELDAMLNGLDDIL